MEKEINFNMTFEEWFYSICKFYDVDLNKPLVNEKINGNNCIVTPMQLLVFFKEATGAQNLFAKLSTATSSKEELLDVWIPFIRDAFPYEETFQIGDVPMNF